MGTLHKTHTHTINIYKTIFRRIFLRKRNFSEVSDKIKKGTFSLNIIFWKLFRLLDNVEKYGTARHTTHDNIIRCLRFACWLDKAMNTQSRYKLLLSTRTIFTQRYVMAVSTLPILFCVCVCKLCCWSILTHWGRVTQICVFNTRLFSLHNKLNYAIHRACLRMVLLTDVYWNLTSLWINL